VLLLLEEVFEGLARVAVARGGSGCGGGSFLGVGGWGGVLLYRGAEFVEGAIVFGVFGSDALGNGLRTFKLGAGVEEAALLAAVQLELAFGALSVGIEAGGEDRAAVGAAGAGYRADHARGAGPELIGAGAALRGPAIVIVAIAVRFFLVVFFGVAIAAVTVLSIHKRLRPSVLDGLQLKPTIFAR
jgi:hypothetical protein